MNVVFSNEFFEKYTRGNLSQQNKMGDLDRRDFVLYSRHRRTTVNST